jgi:hypothetical protein
MKKLQLLFPLLFLFACNKSLEPLEPSLTKDFSSRIYAPVFDGKWKMIENAAIELGAGFRLK